MIKFFEGLDFFAILAVVLVIGVGIRCIGKTLRYYIPIVSLVFIYLVFRENPEQLLALVGYVVYESVLLLIALKYRSAKKIVGTLILLAALPLVLSKIATVVQLTWFSFLGISYVSFKSLQVLFEIYDGIIQKFSLVDYINFLLFFPSLSSGPIDRSGRFLGDLHGTTTKEEYLELVGTGIFRLVLGMVYKIVVAGYVYTWMNDLKMEQLYVYSILYMYLYTAYLFFDFAGYSLMAVGVSNILGIQTPMNFNRPFLSMDIKDFWNRWHITLSTWLRDFVFTRVVMLFMKKKWIKTRLNTAMIAYMVNMLVMGLWHGISTSYIFYGLYHGILMAGFEYYQKKSAFYKKHKKKAGYRCVSWFVTMHLIMIGFFIFSGKWEFVLQKLMK